MPTQEQDAFMTEVMGMPASAAGPAGAPASTAAGAAAQGATIAVHDDGGGRYTVTGTHFTVSEDASENAATVDVMAMDTEAFTSVSQDVSFDKKGGFTMQLTLALVPGDKVNVEAYGHGNPREFSNTVPMVAQADPSHPVTPRNPVIRATAGSDRKISVTGTGFLRVTEVEVVYAVVSGQDTLPEPDTAAVDPQQGTFSMTSRASFGPGESWSVLARSKRDKRVTSPAVSVTLAADPNDPATTDQRKNTDLDLHETDDTFEAALQGASGKGLSAEDAASFAQSVSEEAFRTSSARYAALRSATKDPANLSVNDYKKYFNDSIQGLASSEKKPDAVVAKAHDMAMAAVHAQTKKLERLDWTQIELPHPMVPDCEVVHGKVHGPKNHVLCKTHGHVVDTEAHMVIAHSLAEYDAKHKAHEL